MAEFARWEMAAGGPDYHLSLAAEMSREVPLEERIWRGGCYMAVYNAPYGEVIWRAWPLDRVRREGEGLEPWLRENFPRIAIHRHRRTVKRPEWMHQYLTGYLDLCNQFEELVEKPFEEVWGAVNNVPRVGRYAAIKLVEYLNRCCGLNSPILDIRPKNGHSPRKTLAALWGEPGVAEDDNSLEALARVNHLVGETLSYFQGEHGVTLDMFQMQVFLCEYWQSSRGKQYPGKSVDSELAYAIKAEAAWGHKSETWETRKRLSPLVQLGEHQGWDGPRKALEGTLKDHGYTWSDQVYDWGASTSDLANPVRR